MTKKILTAAAILTSSIAAAHAQTTYFCGNGSYSTYPCTYDPSTGQWAVVGNGVSTMNGSITVSGAYDVPMSCHFDASGVLTECKVDRTDQNTIEKRNGQLSWWSGCMKNLRCWAWLRPEAKR